VQRTAVARQLCLWSVCTCECSKCGSWGSSRAESCCSSRASSPLRYGQARCTLPVPPLTLHCPCGACHGFFFFFSNGHSALHTRAVRPLPNFLCSVAMSGGGVVNASDDAQRRHGSTSSEWSGRSSLPGRRTERSWKRSGRAGRAAQRRVKGTVLWEAQAAAQAAAGAGNPEGSGASGSGGGAAASGQQRSSPTLQCPCQERSGPHGLAPQSPSDSGLQGSADQGETAKCRELLLGGPLCRGGLEGRRRG